MDLMTIWTLASKGRHAEALTALEPFRVVAAKQRQETAWLLLRAGSRHALGDKTGAHADLSSAVEQAEDETQRGRALLEQGGFYLKDRRVGEGIQALLEAVPRLTLRPDLLLNCRYNLGWAFLNRLELEAAREQFMSGLRLTRGDTETRTFRSTLHSGLSVYARLTGDPRWAASIARLTQSEAQLPEQHVQAARSLSMALWRLGQLKEALECVQTARRQATGAVGGSMDFTALCLTERGEDVALDVQEVLGHLDTVLEQDRTRVYLHAAEAARCAGDPVQARALTEKALALGDPYSLLDEAAVLPALYAQARAWDLPLPVPHPPAPHSLHLRVIGEVSLVINAHPQGLQLSNDAAALLAFLIINTEASLRELAQNTTDRNSASAVQNALRDVRRTVCDQAVVLSRSGSVRLSPDWHWSCDLQDALARRQLESKLLPGSYAPWIEELQQQLKPESD